jgi:uncharacterized protein with ATP-grasp and redox domains
MEEKPRRAMAIQPECHACLVGLVDLAVHLATSDNTLQRQAKDAALAILNEEFPRPGAIPALIASRFHKVIMALTGNPDLFASYKARETEFLARMYEHLAPAFAQDLESLLKLAVLGNAVDFFREPDEVAQEFMAPLEFGVSDLKAWRLALNGPPGLLLYLADNAGEQYFDGPLVMHLRRRGWEVVYVVKGGPIQNDLTRADLKASGLADALAPVVDTGAATVGLDLAEVSPEFQRLYDQARLILAKGMGHFETMSHLADPRVFFLLQAKCRPVAQALGAPRRTFVFCQGSAIIP